MGVPRRILLELRRPTATVCRAQAKSSGRRLLHKSTAAKAIPSSSNFRSHALPKNLGGLALIAAFAGACAISILTDFSRSTTKLDDSSVEATKDERQEAKPGHFRLAEIRLHDGNSAQPWVTRGNSVYDITDWVGVHPGGEVILRAAGGSIDAYWNIFTIHKKQDVYDILEQYKIGEIDPLDLVNGQLPQQAIDDPFLTDPARDPHLRVLTAKPCDAETPSMGLEPFLTPNNMFYVRNHMWVPVIEETEHRLTIEMPDGEEKSYTVADLKARFKPYKITATLQCAGNRRKDMTDHAQKTNGLQWTAGAISSAEWEGVRLRDVLLDAGLDVTNLPPTAQHAQFSGHEAYGSSIPMTKAVDPHGDVLLAFKMNGEDLPRDHGYPLRVIVPGTVAARSVKWLRKVVISDEESMSQWQRRDYKCFGPNVGASPDWSKAPAIQEMPITSAITSISHPSCGSKGTTDEDRKPLTIEGYAYSGGGRSVIRVDISLDGGSTWDQATLLDNLPQSKGAKAWCWKRWRYSVSDMSEPGPESTSGRREILVKATDEAYNTQPESYRSIYNARGNLATAWHRVVVNTETEAGSSGGRKESKARS